MYLKKAVRVRELLSTSEITMYQALFHKIHESKANLLIIKLAALLSNIENPSENEREGLLEDRTFKFYNNTKRKNELAQYYSEYANEDDRRLLYDLALSGLTTITKNGLTVLADTASKYYNVVNGMRVTTGNPDNYERTIHIFGHCNGVGCFAEDKLTIASQLQERFNISSPNTVRVVNASNWQSFEDTARQILSPRYLFRPNDFVIVLTHSVEPTLCAKALDMFQDKSFYAYCDLSKVFQRPHNYGEVLFDDIHMNHRGYTILAQHIHKIISRLIKDKQTLKQTIPNDLIPYMNYLSMLKRKRGNASGIIGSLVMNCNPFTHGHKYIVSEALKRCEYLYIFILDEEKSFLKFDDRIRMAKIGLQEFANVSIVPSGKTIISAETMPEYFDKDSLQDVKIDTSYDLVLFSALIAPALNITKRFAGSEPFCQITKQYNDGMRHILPQYGIEFVEIQRYSIDGNEVSASRVRKFLETGEYEKIKELVPQTTYDFLRKKHFSHE